MRLAQLQKEIRGLRHMVDALGVISSPGRRVLLDIPWSADQAELDRAYDSAEEFTLLWQRDKTAADKLCLQLMAVKEIKGNISKLTGGNMLDDLDLFEIKAFCIAAMSLRNLLNDAGLKSIDIPDLQAVVELLDPDGRRIPHFYIYNDYDPRLAPLREQARQSAGNNEQTNQITDAILEVEREVCQRLTAELSPIAPTLGVALDAVAWLDIRLAQGRLNNQLGLCRPKFGKTTSYSALFNPEVAESLRLRRMRYQPVDFSFSELPTLVTGSNMTGKSVLLKTLALAQTLAQLGFFVPAAHAVVELVDGVALCIGDEQSELSGLSSYAAEMLRLDAALRRIADGEHLLLLADEPARTTNPAEGRAIVSALLDWLADSSSPAVITTHYDNVSGLCRRVRIRGLSDVDIPLGATAADLNRIIDYSPVPEDSMTNVPREALRIASVLGVSRELIERAEHHLENNESSN